MAVDISKLGYDVVLITENGAQFKLNDALLALAWEEQENELAQRATVKLSNFKVSDKYLIHFAALNCVIRIYGKWGGPSQLLFEGHIWEWDYSSAGDKVLTLTVYDNLIRLQQSKDFGYYAPGMDTKAVVTDICKKWEIPLNYEWVTITHGEKKFRGANVSDMIFELLKEVKDKTGKSEFHTGIDIPAPAGTPIAAAEGGLVVLAGNNGGYGLCVKIEHSGGLVTLYGHNSKLLVRNGEKVSRGQTIALCGSTGMSTGAHLHFEVRKGGTAVNPNSYVSP